MGRTTTSPSTTPSTTAHTTSDVVAAFLDDLESELTTWGVSEDSIACVTTGLIDGGYVQGLDDAGVLDLLLLDESAPLEELPPEIAPVYEGLALYLYDPQVGCLRPNELAAAAEHFAIQAVDTGLSSYGDDPTMDELYDGCADGSLADCDMLFLAADFGSEYEAMGGTCGQTIPTHELGTTCMIAVDDLSEAADLASQCESGFFIACDVYYLITIVGSPEEEFAASCGGIREPSQTAPCWLVYGFGTR